jgi:uncharacterized protein YciI
MEFVVIAKDYQDEDCLNRRMSVRPDHMTLIKHLNDQGHILVGGAMLDDVSNAMKGSVLVVSFQDRDALQSLWLDQEPYLKGRVWEHVEVIPYKVASLGQPLFDQIQTGLMANV